MKVVSVVGARPQFIKAVPVSLQLRRRHREVLLSSSPPIREPGRRYAPRHSGCRGMCA